MPFFTTNNTWAQKAQQGHGKLDQVLSVDIAPSLESELPLTSISCSQCRQPVVPDDHGYSQAKLGQIMWLPDTKRMPQTSVVFHPEADVNDGAGNHPALVAMMSQCGCLAYCMPMTSFSKGGIQQKFSRARDPQKFYDAYMPLREHSTPDTNSRGMLDYDGDRMNKQSYVHLEFGYWIEWSNLQDLSDNQTSALTPRSLYKVKQAYAVAEIDRRRTGRSEAKERLARHSRSPSPPLSWQSSQSISPPMLTTFLSAPQRWAPPTPPPSPPTFVLVPRVNAAIAIKKSPSREKIEAMNGSWR